MHLNNLLRFWKAEDEDEELINEREQALLPTSPAGQIELSEEELAEVNGGTGNNGGQRTLYIQLGNTGIA